MENVDEINKEALLKIHKNLQKIYTLIEIEQETLSLCQEKEKDPTHLIILTDIILDKLQTTMNEFEIILF